VRDEVVDYVRQKHRRTELPAKQLVKWLGIGMSKFYHWQARYGRANEHNALGRGTIGSRRGRRKRFSRSTPPVRWRATVG
jgi:hypothetical protein